MPAYADDIQDIMGQRQFKQFTKAAFYGEAYLNTPGSQHIREHH